ESGEVAQASGSPGGDSRIGLAVVAIATRELAQTRELIEETPELMAASDNPPSPRMLALLGDVAPLQDDLGGAERFGRNAVEHSLNLGLLPAVPFATLAHIALAKGQPARAAALLAASDDLLEKLDSHFNTFEWRRPDQLATDIRVALGEPAYTT